MAGNLAHPLIAFPEATPRKVREQVMAILNDKGCRFLEGHFINASTTLQYGGSTDALSRMLAGLAECEGIRIKVTFVRKAGGASWTLSHNAWADAGYIGIQVNLAAALIDLEHLDLPVLGKTAGAPEPGSLVR
jgi:hypothetical protein